MHQKFLGWNKPLLHLAADYLIGRFHKQNHLDMRNVVLTLPGQRAIDHLEEILAEKSEKLDPAWYPPEFLTIGVLPEKFYDLKKPTADDLTQCFAWLHAVEQLDNEHPGMLRRILPAPPDRNDLKARLALGQMFARLHRELAANTLDFTDAAEICRKLNISSEVDRWEILDKLQQKYLAKLDSLGIWDIQSARLYAINQKNGEEAEQIRTEFRQKGTQFFLVGLVDLNLAQKEILRQFQDFVTPLIFAPEKLADRFDEFGCLNSDAWQDVSLDLKDEQIHVVESVGDQAEEVLQCLTALNGKFAPPEIIVGVPDRQVIPALEQQFEQAGIKSRLVEGTSIRQSSVYRFLETLLNYEVSRHSELPNFAPFAELVRHPEVEKILNEKLPNIVEQLDQYHTEFLPVEIGNGKELEDEKIVKHNK